MENNLSIVKDTFKELPNNIVAEQAVIGSILVQNETFDEINTIVSSVNFYDPMHQSIFSARSNNNLSEFSIIFWPLTSRAFSFAASIVFSDILINSLLTNIS